MNQMVNENIQCFIDCANELVRADEVNRALWLLDNLPAWRRDHPHPDIVSLKNEIMKRMATPSFYSTDVGAEVQIPGDTHLAMVHTIRGDLLTKETKWLNANKFSPKVYDLGPGEFWTPKMLIHQGIEFTYYPIYMNHPTYQHYKKDFEHKISKEPNDQPKIFFACEIIEHLHHEEEIRYEMNRHAGSADIIHLSTPCYTFDYVCQDWKANKKDLGHLRAYTPTEFFLKVQTMFPEYNIQMFSNEILHVRGVHKDTKFDLIKNTNIQDILK